jgi:hypothetical protein
MCGLSSVSSEAGTQGYDVVRVFLGCEVSSAGENHRVAVEPVADWPA